MSPFPDASTRTQVSLNGGHSPAWSPATNELFYVGVDGGMWSVRYDTDRRFEVLGGTRTRLFDASGYYVRSRGGGLHNYDVSADGERFVMMKRADGAAAGVRELVLVMNAAGAVEGVRGR